MMRKLVQVVTLATLVLQGLDGQTRIDVGRQAKGKEGLLAPFASPVRTGGTLPSECVPGELYFLTSAPSGGNLYGCHEDNSWSPQGSAGQGYVTVLNGGQIVGVRPGVEFRAGLGVLQMISDDGTNVTIQTAVDTGVVLTSATHQTGRALLCESHASSSNYHECMLSPAISAYARGMIIHWIPNADIAPGPATISIDGLGELPVKMGDGVTDPEDGAFVAGNLYIMWHDGVSFRPLTTLISSSYRNDQLEAAKRVSQSGSTVLCVATATVSSNYTCSLDPELGTYQFGMLLHFIPDVPSSGGPSTVQLGQLGVVPLKASDGSRDPNAGELRAGQINLIWFDGSSFRLVPELVESIGFGMRPNCDSGYRGRLWFSEGNTGEDDSLAVCARDAADTYGWRSVY